MGSQINREEGAQEAHGAEACSRGAGGLWNSHGILRGFIDIFRIMMGSFWDS